MTVKDRKLTQVQLDLLMLLYKFRFGTSSLLAVSSGKKDDKFISPRLKLLLSNCYIGRNYDKSYIKLAKPASFYLLPKALRALREITYPEGLDDQAIKSSYKDKTASKQFIERSLNLYAIYNMLTGLHKGLQMFLKRELADNEYSYFPNPLPDAFLLLNKQESTCYFFADYFEVGTQPLPLDYRLRKYVTYHENNEWAVTGLPFPTVLCIAEDARTERLVQRQANRVLSRSDTDITISTTTLKELLASQDASDPLWSDVKEPEHARSLVSLAD
jgi:hypothetical protein